MNGDPLAVAEQFDRACRDARLDLLAREANVNLRSFFGHDKFAGVDWHPSPLGSPIVNNSLAHIDCTVQSVHDGGDHFVVFGRVRSLSELPTVPPRPLLFYRGEYTGIEPEKNTPAQWRDDLEAFLTATTPDTWL